MEKFRKYPNDMFKAKTITSDKGKLLGLDPTIKQVYLYMLVQYEFFLKNTDDGVFFENQDSIGEECGVSRHTIIRTVKKLTDIGVVEVKKKRLANGAWSNNYIVHRVDGVRWWYDDKKGAVQPQQSVVAKKQQPVPSYIDDCPF